MNLYLILGLLCIGAHGEKRINLEDIERDNLRAEGVSKSGNAGVEEPKYLQRYQAPIGVPVTYVPPETYVRSDEYAVKEQAYQRHNVVLPERISPQLRYNEYQQQSSLSPKGIAPNVRESHSSLYQPEVNVGNRFQAVRQSTATAKYKYAEDANKGAAYVDVPTMYLFTYYPNLDANFGKTGDSSVPRLAAAATEHISIPLYSSAPSANSIVPVGPAISSTKIAKGAIYTGPATSKRYNGSPFASVQGRQFLYTQAYIVPSDPRYVSRLAYSDVYAPVPSYDRDYFPHGSTRRVVPAEQLDSPTRIADEPPNRISSQHPVQSIRQSYVQEPEEPIEDLVPPRMPAQDVETETTPLSPISSRDEESISEQNRVDPSEPKSLLDSYVPSKLIAAQDAFRYRERPIKLESGFLPSKENFVHKKRKTDRTTTADFYSGQRTNVEQDGQRSVPLLPLLPLR